MDAPGPPPAEQVLPLFSLKGVGVFVLLIALGMAGNHFKFTLFFNADLVFGSVFAMLALQLFGTAAGSAAALLISLPLILLWGHPYAVVVMTAETAAVGWLNGRRRIGLAQADVVYWLLAGLPMVYGSYHLAMKVPQSATLFIMVKDFLNGLANVLLARLAFYALRRLGRRPPVPYREAIFNTVVAFVLTTALVMTAVESRQDFRTTDQRTRATLLQDAQRTTHALALWGEHRRMAIAGLAQTAALIPPGQVQPFVEHTMKSHTGFLRVGLVDRSGRSFAFCPVLDQAGLSNIGKDISATPFIPALRQTLQPLLSEVFVAQLGPPAPIVTMAAPILRNGAYDGYVTGVLDTKPIMELLSKEPSTPGTLVTLLDQNDRVILTTRPGQKVMEPLVRGSGTLKRLSPELQQWLPALPPNTPTMERWSRSFYVTQARVDAWSPWKLVMEQPTAPFQAVLVDRYTRVLFVVFLLVLGSMSVAELVSRRLTSSLEALRDLTLDLPGRLDSGPGQAIAWPDSGILEPSHLMAQFRQMAASLEHQFQEIQGDKSTLERRVAERTEELVRSKEEFRLLAEVLPQIVWATRKDGWNTYFNQQWVDYTGLSLEESYGHGWITPFHPDDRQRAWDAWQNAVTHGATYSLECQLRRADGVYRWWLVRGAPLFDEAGQIIKWFGTCTDIHELKAANELNAQLQAQLFQSQKMESLGGLAGGVAHDMNNILGAILAMGSAHLTLQPRGTPLYQALETIVQAADRGGAMVKGLLAFARQQPAEERELDLNDVLRQTIALLEHTTLAKVQLETRLAPGLHPVLGDAGALGNAIMNLCVNAVDAMPSQGILRLRTRNLGEDQVEIEVEDTGHGMPPEVLAKALDPFFTTKETGKGTGLGLSMAYRCVEAHRGRMRIQSEPGRGTCIRIVLPACRPATPLPLAQAPDAARDATHRLKVLLVDDDELIKKSTQMLIEILGHTVVTVSSGEEGLLALEEGALPDLVILDMNMPGLGGAGTMPLLRARHPAIPVLLATGRVDQEALDLVARDPMAALLPKPFGIEDLKAHFGRFAQG